MFFRRLRVEISDSLTPDLIVILDNSTRWNSTFFSLRRALEVRKRIELFCYEYRVDLEKDLLSDQEWVHIHQVVQGLHPFFEVTKRLEGQATNGHHGAIWEALPAIAALLEAMEQGREKMQGLYPRGNNPMAVAYQNAWEKLRKYYGLTDDAHSIYGAAILLHPSHRKQYFDFYWQGDEALWKNVLIKNVKDTWEEEYRSMTVNEPTVPEHPPTLMEAYLRRAQRGDRAANADEFDAYINGSCIEFGDADAVITWVIDSNLRQGIKQQLLDLLSIPAMSAELERVFSQAKFTVTAGRNRLTAHTIEMLELLRHWWVNNTIQQSGLPYQRRQRRKRKAIDDGSELLEEDIDQHRGGDDDDGILN